MVTVTRPAGVVAASELGSTTTTLSLTATELSLTATTTGDATTTTCCVGGCGAGGLVGVSGSLD